MVDINLTYAEILTISDALNKFKDKKTKLFAFFLRNIRCLATFIDEFNGHQKDLITAHCTEETIEKLKLGGNVKLEFTDKESEEIYRTAWKNLMETSVTLKVVQMKLSEFEKSGEEFSTEDLLPLLDKMILLDE